MRRDGEVEAVLRSWLDHVIIPALVRQYREALKVRGLRLERGDNNREVANRNDPTEAQP